MPVYVQHEVLGKVPDVFNAEALWQAPGLALFARRPLLRDLLERSPREHRGRAATRCFSHVTLMLPQDDVDDDRHLTRGARVRDLAQTLKALHQKDFGDLLGSDEVRYHVEGTDALAPGQVEVKFGHAVYLPAPEEKVLYAVTASRDSAIWKPVCAVYPEQRLALIGHDAEAASYAVPDWPFGTAGAVLLVNDGPDAPIEVQVRPKDAFDCRFDPLNGYYTIKAKQGGSDARVLLRISRVGPPSASTQASASASAIKPAAVWKVRANGVTGAAASANAGANAATGAFAGTNLNGIANLAEAEQTATPVSHRPAAFAPNPGESDATYAPLARQCVSLVALALPRLSRYRDTGAESLDIGLDATLGIAAEGRDTVIRFAVDAADELHAITAAGRQRIAAPANFTPVDGAAVKLLAVAPEMADRYCATLCLPRSASVAVASGARFVFGRGATMLAALRVLDSARFLRRAEGADTASADRLGLSRNAFSFEASAAGYKIGRLSATQALYHLDEQMRFVASIGAAGADQPYLLPPGHHLVAGHYVLRFDA